MAPLVDEAKGLPECEAVMNAADNKSNSEDSGSFAFGPKWLGEAFKVYVDFMKSGWFEAFEHQEQPAEKGVCPLRPLLAKTNELLNQKDQLA